MGYTDTTGFILGQQEPRLAASNVPDNKSSLDKDSFLTILVAQLTHQDPLNPMEDTEMTSQLAEFSSLEQLTSINTGIGDLATSMQKSDMISAVSFIGKEVKAEGYKVALNEGNASTIYYGFGETVSGIMINIYDSEGAIVRTVELGNKEAGSYQYEWDGKDDDGKPPQIMGVTMMAPPGYPQPGPSGTPPPGYAPQQSWTPPPVGPAQTASTPQPAPVNPSQRIQP